MSKPPKTKPVLPFPTCSRHLEKVWNKKMHSDHELRLNRVHATNRGNGKAFFDNAEPTASKFTHVYTRAKQKQAEMDRKCEINRNQNQMIDRIDKIFNQNYKQIATKSWSRWLNLEPGLKINPNTMPIIDNQGGGLVEKRQEGIKYRSELRRQYWKGIEADNEKIFRRIKEHEGYSFADVESTSPSKLGRSSTALGVSTPKTGSPPKKLKQSASPLNRITMEKHYRQQEKYTKMLQKYPYEPNSSARKTVLKKREKVWLPEMLDMEPYEFGLVQSYTDHDVQTNISKVRGSGLFEPNIGDLEPSRQFEPSPNGSLPPLPGLSSVGPEQTSFLSSSALNASQHSPNFGYPQAMSSSPSPLRHQQFSNTSMGGVGGGNSPLMTDLLPVRNENLRNVYGALQEEQGKIQTLEEEMSDIGTNPDEEPAGGAGGGLEHYLDRLKVTRSTGEDRISQEIKQYESNMARAVDQRVPY